MAARLVASARRTGLLDDCLEGGPLALLRVALRHGLDIRSIHRLHAAWHSERPAAIDRRRTLDYGELDREIDRFAAALADRFEVGSGTPVVLTMENRVEYVVGWFALFRLGARAVHVSYRATADELAYHLEHSGARLVVGSQRNRSIVDELREQSSRPDVAFIDTDRERSGSATHAYRSLVAGRAPSQDVSTPTSTIEGSEAGNVVYTSGTTGRPKGTVRDFARMGMHDLFRIVERLPVQTGDRHLVVAPIYHSGGQVFTMLNMALGATLYLEPQFEPESTLRALSRRSIQSVFMVPTMIRRLLNLPDALLENHPTSDLRALVSGAAPFSTDLRRRAMQQFGTGTVHDFYGATELGWVTLIDGFEMRERPGSVGRPIGGQQIRIFDEAGDECEPGEVGEIYVRSPHTMEGYLDDPEANRESRRGEWWTVEDLGYLDEDEYLYLAGRARDMVVTGGVNVYPVEIEDRLCEHPRVDEAGVVGVDDPEWGEKLIAFVVGAEDGEPDEEELEAYLRSHVAGYKVPKAWRFVDALPRNPTGKILKGELREQFDGAPEA